MAILTKCLTSISPDLQAGPSPGRRLLAITLCAMLTFGSVIPGLAFASEVDSEGVGTAPEVEVPVVPDFDPGGEETGLEEEPASGGDEETGAVEVEPELDTEAPASTDVTSTAEGVIETEQPQTAVVPEVATAAPEPEPVEQKAPETSASGPVANQSIVAPRRQQVERHVANEHTPPAEAPLPSEPAEEEAPSPPRHPVATPVDTGRNLAGKAFYVVREGDCLSHIAAALLPPGADTTEIELEVDRLWRLNADRIGTEDPDLIYPGTVLRLR